MARPLNVRRPSTREVRRLSKLMAGGVNRHRQRRAEALLLYGMGVSPLRIAAAQGVHVNTVYTDLHAFAAAGIRAIEQLQPAGAPARLTASQEARIVQLAEQLPGEVGQPYGRWSLRKLSTYLVKAHIVKAIGRERLRQVLKKRCLLAARPAQAHQHRPATAGHLGADPLDFPAFAAQRSAVVLRRQANCRQSLRRSALYLGQAARAGAQPENARVLLPVPDLRRGQWSGALDGAVGQRHRGGVPVHAPGAALVSGCAALGRT